MLLLSMYILSNVIYFICRVTYNTLHFSFEDKIL